MKILLITIFIIVIISCSGGGSRNPNTNVYAKEFIEVNSEKKNKEQLIDAFYKRDSTNTLLFSKIVKDSSSFRFIIGKIVKNSYTSSQFILENNTINKNDILTLSNQFIDNGYVKYFMSTDEELFIQIALPEMEIKELYAIRINIEDKISNIIEREGLGHYSASDFGPGGLNIIFKVNDYNRSSELVLNILKSLNYLNITKLARRNYLFGDEWDYEVVFPIDYPGEFNVI